jgi:predicted nucleic acid-binding protein
MSLLCQRTTAQGVPEIRAWVTARTLAGALIYIPEIADYEVRRKCYADVTLAAQAEKIGATVATDNVRHLARYVPARLWRDIG